MRLPRLAAARPAFLATLALALGGAAIMPAATAAAAPAVNYVALGDSYSSGVGAPGITGLCVRSPEGYPTLWANSHHVTSFTDATCAGAVTTDLIANQVQSLTAQTTVVTVTIGGNDANFAGTVLICELGGDAACASTVQSDIADPTLPGKLDRAYAAIRAAAPNAQVYVLGYPHLLEVTPSCPGELSLAKRQALYQGADALAALISAHATAAGFHYVDVRAAFAGHGLCAPTPWINGLLSLGPFHPNAAGYQGGYLTALDAATG